ncbi:MAG: hypothetical protein Q4G04_03160 [bacterium]|nr:hypothetical protein [bacterium]
MNKYDNELIFFIFQYYMAYTKNMFITKDEFLKDTTLQSDYNAVIVMLNGFTIRNGFNSIEELLASISPSVLITALCIKHNNDNCYEKTKKYK